MFRNFLKRAGTLRRRRNNFPEHFKMSRNTSWPTKQCLHLGFGGTTDDEYCAIGWIYRVNGPAVRGVSQFAPPRTQPAQVSVRMWVGSGRVGVGGDQ